PPDRAATHRIMTDAEVSNIPSAIFVGVDGSRPILRSQFQNAISGNVSTMIQNGLIALEITPETSLPSTSPSVKICIRTGVTRELLQSVLSLAHFVSVKPFW